jgi:hypothetical protein
MFTPCIDKADGRDEMVTKCQGHHLNLADADRNGYGFFLHKTNTLKVHKNENFFGFDFEGYYFIVSYVKILRLCKKNLFDWASIGGGTIFPRSPRTTRNGKNF